MLYNSGAKVYSTINLTSDFFPSLVRLYHNNKWYYAEPYIFTDGEWRPAFFGQPEPWQFILNNNDGFQVKQSSSSTTYDDLYVWE